MGQFVIDCSESVEAGLCKASRANDPRGLRLIANRDVKAKANMVMTINRITKRAYLVAMRNIQRGEELFVSYGSDFHVVLHATNLLRT